MKSKYLRPLLLIIGMVALNVLASFFYVRLDLTEDQRYSLSDATKNLLDQLDEEVYVKVYLDGDLNPGFRHLRESVRETLEEFKAQSGGHLEYRFIDPSAETNGEKRNAFYESLTEKGLIPTNVVEGGEDSRTQKLVWPGALLTYQNKETAVQLLKGNISKSAQENLNLSAENIEYTLATALRELTQKEKKKIGLLSTFSKKLNPVRISDLIVALQKHYEIYQVNLQTSPNLGGLDAVLVVKPDQEFSEDDQLKLDQFIVHGGKAMFLIDQVQTDSVGREGVYAQPTNLKLDELLFRYGLRANPVVVKDLLSAEIPLNIGTMGDKANIQLMPWRFYPLLNSFGKSPITRNLDAIYGRYVGSLDTVGAEGIRKTPLLFTSAYTQNLHAPAVIPYNEAGRKPDPTQYNGGPKAVAYLLEGKFSSLFRNRLLPDDPRAKGFAIQDQPSKIVVVADGDMALNDFDPKREVPLPLGFDRFSPDRHVYANKDFILNAMDYMLDDNGVITARTKEFKLRPLDKIQVDENRTAWQVLNLLGPLVLIALLGGGWYFWRRKEYAV
ncbi:gliding motility-associated ABC transporter substrate-binding protein GldG [Siphonobacter sp. BAB-5385]|uniref:gliding motility-associated ABC transporter substrate-binding protein GldG n=1 Tax=Siphonobacter sp. BAB-5385 TaxID=1864822 RepID=UPI000B9DDD46|nr:gliding motility-associated ABC transporter substrate-binding protein GldG [Siphonobacter sp. BAB-5385]OZI07840.1 gliding motility-associated ABC transporter substrate-binding protein GldG [Siphonobacter sp. BAB-5385]